MKSPEREEYTYDNRRDAILYFIDYASEKKWFQWVTNKLSVIF